MSHIFSPLFLFPSLAAFAVAVLVTPVVISFYKAKGWLDDPRKNTHAKVTHQQAVPRGGGVPILLALVIVGGYFIGWDKHFLGIAVGAMVLAIVGVIDDIWDINPYVRLLTGAFAALCVVAAGIGIAYVTNPFSAEVIHLDQPQLAFFLAGKVRTIWLLADLFAVIWIIWLMNIVNWSKGLDGQMPGFVAIAAVFIGLLSFRFIDDVTQWDVIKLAAITAGAYIGLLVWNFYPQKIMPGYGGGSLAGYLLAVLSILSGAKVATLVLVVGVPMIDAGYTILRRLYAKRSPVWGDRGHLHHRLLDLGWSKPQIAFFYWIATAVLGLAALHLNSSQKLFAIIMLILGLGGLLLWLKLARQIQDE